MVVDARRAMGGDGCCVVLWSLMPDRQWEAVFVQVFMDINALRANLRQINVGFCLFSVGDPRP